MTVGKGCTIYEWQTQERYCRVCPDEECRERWQAVEAAFPLDKSITLSDANGVVQLKRVATPRANSRPFRVRWHQKTWDSWEKTTFLLYWKSLGQNRKYVDPNGRLQAERIAKLVKAYAKVK